MREMEVSLEVKPRVCFTVEKVIGISADGNYQVQWAPAWVSKFHLVGCEHLIQEFLHQQTHKEGEYERRPPEHPPPHQTEQNDVHTLQSTEYIPEKIDGTPALEPDKMGCQAEVDVQTLSDIAEDSTLMDESSTFNDENDGFRLQESCSVIMESNTSELLKNVVIKVEDETEIVVPTEENDLLPKVCNSSSSSTFSNQDESQNSLQHSTHIETTNLPNRYSQHSNLKPHKKFVCHVCERPFRSTGHLRDHIMTHTGVRPFSCQYCTQTFIQKTHLKKHIARYHSGGQQGIERLQSSVLEGDRIEYSKARNSTQSTVHQDEVVNNCNNAVASQHNGVGDPKKKYACYVCERRFRSSGHLKDHIRTHTGVKPYPCNVCGERFIQKSNLKKHVKRYHPENEGVKSLHMQPPLMREEPVDEYLPLSMVDRTGVSRDESVDNDNEMTEHDESTSMIVLNSAVEME